MNQLEKTGSRWEIGEAAMAAFERIHRLNVTVHDLAGTLGPFLPPHRFHHCSAFCLAVKAHRLESCAQFDIKRVRSDLATQPEGRFHICHAGVVEWAVPVFAGAKLHWVLFAGPRFPGPDLVSAVAAPQIQWPRGCWSKGAGLPPPVGEEEAQLILEHLRQLSARLRLWVRELNLNASMIRTVPDEFVAGAMTSVGTIHRRRETILRFIEEKFQAPVSLPMLARRLCLSPSRASHVVRRTCDANFRELVIQKRLRVAIELLRQSSMSVLEVALASGFGDLAHFHRIFRRRIGDSPGAYRLNGSGLISVAAQQKKS